MLAEFRNCLCATILRTLGWAPSNGESRDADDDGMYEFPQTVDYQIKNILPDGATCHYASPEVLRALQLTMEGYEDDHPGALLTFTILTPIVILCMGCKYTPPSFSNKHDRDVLMSNSPRVCVAGMQINGPAADLWSVGVLLHEVLTSKLPFCPDENAALPKAPAGVADAHQELWGRYQAMLELQINWVSGSCVHALLLHVCCMGASAEEDACKVCCTDMSIMSVAMAAMGELHLVCCIAVCSASVICNPSCVDVSRSSVS